MKDFKFKIHDNNYKVRVLSHEGNMIDIEVNGTSYTVKMKEEIRQTKTPTLVRSASKRPAEPLKVNPASQKTKIFSPLPGSIMSISIKVGDQINEGDSLLVLEAMKMENNIIAEKGGVVTAIHVSAGQQVLQNDLLIELE
ncbi:MAG: acetyl-CoA carboxylase biotin carboxyl carrier protein subunit [Flavobacteriia bacterium]|nr:MAG: acetyl-CoA carboxylase biotin carboxyl carrier protein subunit [Flavobacteriia bacterium]